ncbi:MAG: AsmA-like C-terminal region-containing protein [Alphaproteobacteria bacterium]
MLRSVGNLAKRLIKFALELTAAAVGLTIILVGLLAWRAGSGPITVDTFAPELAGLLSNPAAGIRTDIGHAMIMWDRDVKALRLVTTMVKIYDRNDKMLAELPQLSLGLNFLAPLRDLGSPLEIFSHDFNLRLLRETDGSFHFGGLQLEDDSAAPDETLDIKEYLRALLRHNTGWLGLGRVGSVKIKHITVQVTDRATRQDWALKFPHINLVRSRRGLSAKVWVEADKNSGGSSVILDVSSNRKTKILETQASFADLNPALWVDRFPQLKSLAAVNLPLSGTITLRLNEEIQPISAQVSIAGQAGQVSFPDSMAKPVVIKSAVLQADADFLERRVTLKQADFDINGIKVTATGMGRPEDITNNHLMETTLTATVKEWPLDRLGDVWPEGVAPNPRAWISQNMSVGKFTHVSATVNFLINWRDFSDVRNFKLSGKIGMENATIRYIDGMPPVTGVNAEADADQSSLKINVKGGTAGRITLGPSPIVIDGLDGDTQNITIGMAGKNNVADVLWLIDHPPLNYAKKLGLQPQHLSGTAALDVKFKFPLLKDLPLEKMQIDARAKIADLASDKLVRGLAISNGQLELAVEPAQMSVQGKASYNGIPMMTRYRQSFVKSDVAATALQSEAELSGSLSAADWAALGVDLGKDSKGSAPVTIKYAKGYVTPAALDIHADFTPMALTLEMLNWSKTADKPALGQGRLVFGASDGVKIEKFSLAGPMLDVAVSGTLDSATMQPKALLCKPCVVGRTNVLAKIGIIEDVRTIEINGTALDYRGSKEKSTTPATPPKPMHIRIDVDKLYQSDTHYFGKLHAELRRDMLGWHYIDVRGMAEGRVPVVVTLRPDGNRAPLRLSVTTDDLGDLLRAADVTDQVHDGKLSITGNSTFAHPRRIEGEVKLRNYKVRKLPFLAILLNAASFAGFADMLGGSGIGFDRLEGKFFWEGGQVKLEDFRTSGGALGLNLDGTIDFDTNQGDFKGNLIPFSFFSNIIGHIPLVGDILTGGSGGGVFAVTYRAKGDLDKMKFDVNPASVLTPGILRRIFFQGK